MTKVKFEKNVVCGVTTDPSRVRGGIPILVVDDEEEMERVSGLLSRILDAVAHDMGTGVYLVVQH